MIVQQENLYIREFLLLDGHKKRLNTKLEHHHSLGEEVSPILFELQVIDEQIGFLEQTLLKPVHCTSIINRFETLKLQLLNLIEVFVRENELYPLLHRYLSFCIQGNYGSEGPAELENKEFPHTDHDNESVRHFLAKISAELSQTIQPTNYIDLHGLVCGIQDRIRAIFLSKACPDRV